MTTTPEQAVIQAALLPCPFCGGEASLLESCDQPGLDNWFVRCDPCDLIIDSAWCKPKAEAIAAWNTRLAHSQPASEGEAECQFPGCETMTSDGLCRPCDERVTEKVRNLRHSDALKAIANPPTMNGFQALAIWMRRTAAEALK